MKFLAIDSSMANTGIAVGTINSTGGIGVINIGLVQTEKAKNKQVRASSDLISRARLTNNFLKKIVEQYKPEVIFAETPSGSQSSAGAKSYGMTCQLIASLAPPPIEVTPNEVKMASVGKKTASKKEMIGWAVAMYPDLPWLGAVAKNEHMADAIAIAFAAAQTQEFLRLHATYKYE